MTNKTLTGLEAVLLMQEGGYITDGQHIYRFVNTKIEASDITSFNKGKPEWESGNVFNFNKSPKKSTRSLAQQQLTLETGNVIIEGYGIKRFFKQKELCKYEK